VRYPGCEQDGSRLRFPRAPCRREQAVGIAFELGYVLALDLRAIFAGLVAHALEQLGPRDALRIAGVVAGAWDPRRAALAAVDDQDVEVEAREVDGGVRPRGPAADDQAIEDRLVHALPNGL